MPHLLKHLSLDTGSTVLDVGCATGGFSIGIAQNCQVRVTALDISSALLRYARQKEHGRLVRWVHGSATQLPFQDSQFDRILMSMILHQIPDRQAAIFEVARVIKRGGKLVIRTVDPASMQQWLMCRYFPTVEQLEKQRASSLQEVHRLLEAAGFLLHFQEEIARNREFSVPKLMEFLQKELHDRYDHLTEEEVERGLAQLQDDFRSQELVVDPKPCTFLTAERVAR
jgi:ubiquinone/menaquinone biosynthesis C-methylase UbiE